MMTQYDTITRLISGQLSEVEMQRSLNEFAHGLGWKPSDRLDIPSASDVASAHLLVEHGLEHTAVITFLKNTRRFSDLSSSDRERLLTIPYNNLVDWHIPVELDTVNYVYLRTRKPTIVKKHSISRDDFDHLRSEAFEQAVELRPSPNIPALDDALIRTISFWKRNLSAELGGKASNEELSHLFNAIIFARALEDNHYRYNAQRSEALLEVWPASPTGMTAKLLLDTVVRKFATSRVPQYLFDETKLACFDRLNQSILFSLMSDFYRNKFAPYPYDFSIMSKHALSRIYEHYVSILRVEETNQLSFIPPLPDETSDKSYGAFYTPQYIARFFAHYLREKIPSFSFKRVKTLDPACGSGIFLRALLELQCDPIQDNLTGAIIEDVFAKTFGLDIDGNATQATLLSLALLHLVVARSLPEKLNVVTTDAIEYFTSHPEEKSTFDIVLANPPFVSMDTQRPELRARIKLFMGEFASGRIDLYLAFLKLSLDLLKPGGYGLFVLPHSFLLSRQASKMRAELANQCWISFLADLSAVKVFGDTGIYVILLIFQKKVKGESFLPPATIVKSRDMVPRALQDVIDGRRIETPFYSIHNIEQAAFSEEQWLILPPVEATLGLRYRTLPVLSDYLEVKQGFVSGADDVFIVSEEQLSNLEKQVFVPFLHDRDMRAYNVPSKSKKYFFYPYDGAEKIDEDQLKLRFPKTWKYLLGNRSALASRSSLARYRKLWWEPMWPRQPGNMLRPKIVSPHLTLVPRFSVDLVGQYAISHSPIMLPIDRSNENDLLLFFVAVLNSTACYWYVSGHSHKYQNCYVMLEPNTLKRTPVPDLSKIQSSEIRRLIRLVELRLAEPKNATEVEKQIDIMVADLYGLSKNDRVAIGLE